MADSHDREGRFAEPPDRISEPMRSGRMLCERGSPHQQAIWMGRARRSLRSRPLTVGGLELFATGSSGVLSRATPNGPYRTPDRGV
jgi:hypothetical protein